MTGVAFEAIKSVVSANIPLLGYASLQDVSWYTILKVTKSK
jgi:hypothetical protein